MSVGHERWNNNRHQYLVARTINVKSLPSQFIGKFMNLVAERETWNNAFKFAPTIRELGVSQNRIGALSIDDSVWELRALIVTDPNCGPI
jgi:hypothetical protein